VTITFRRLNSLPVEASPAATDILLIQDTQGRNSRQVAFSTFASPTFTAGSVVFAGASGDLSQDNANLFWDDTNKRLGVGTATPGSTLDVGGQITGKFENRGTNVAAMELATNHVAQVTISASTTLTTTVPPAGTVAVVIIVTSGTTSRTVTFGTGFRAVSTLATGSANNRRFVVTFVSDGTQMLESSRTTAITV
jgi:hypothetical protein